MPFRDRAREGHRYISGMIQPRVAASAVLVAMGAVLALSSCSTGSPSTASTTAAGTSPAAPSTVASPTTTSSNPTTSSAPAATVRTVADLKAALLGESDVPAGFSIDSSGSGGPSPKSSSTNPTCAEFNTLMNRDKAPGSKADATVSLDGGQNGPAIDESLDSLGSAASVSALTKRLRAAVKACPSIKLTLPTGESSKMKLISVSAPHAGTSPVAARLTATSGTLAGLEVDLVWTGIDDVLLSMTFLDSYPDEIDGATQAAVEKAQQSLATATASS
jgi:hypothetical protein